jgi:tetratricopeptide (TPR) repeat protein
MKNNYIKYNTIFIICMTLIFSQQFRSIGNKLTLEQQKILSQAKTLENSGLKEEAIIAYKDILSKFPTLKIAFEQLKNIYINTNNLDELKIIAEQYLKSNKNSINSQIDILDIYIITGNPQWKNIVNELYQNKPVNLANVKKILSILLKQNQLTFASTIIESIRSQTKYKSFYALELGNFFTLQLNIESAIDEYLIYLSEKPKNIQFISQRIMAISDYDITIEQIKNKLQKSSIRESKIILSLLEFKLKNYEGSYELHEKQIENTIIILPISNQIYHNEILKSPYINLNKEYKDYLLKATNIYDSLSTHNNDTKSLMNLAKIKYQALNDLDGAENIYNTIYNNPKSKDYKSQCLYNMIDINLSKGDINNSLNEIDNVYSNNLPKDLLDILDIKKIKIYFYDTNRDSLIYYSKKVLKSISREHMLYNDILDILNLFYNYQDQEIKEYIDAKYKIMQNKQDDAIDILEKISKDNPIYTVAQFESIYLDAINGNHQDALEKANYYTQNFSNYKEDILLLEAEIYDYMLSNYSKAADIYLNFLELFPKSIYYDSIRLRLRELAS